MRCTALSALLSATSSILPKVSIAAREQDRVRRRECKPIKAETDNLYSALCIVAAKAVFMVVREKASTFATSENNKNKAL
jgi:hypothetical protein